jgi:hypothetical protein
MNALTILHPGVESPSRAAGPALAPGHASLEGLRVALLDNSKVNAGNIIAAVARLLQSRYQAGEVRPWKKRHAGSSGAAVIPGILAWKPDIALVALGD